MFERPEAFPVYKFEFKIPATVREVRVPTEVMLGCEACDTTKAKVACATFPVTLEPVMFERPEALEPISSPFTVRPVSVPTDVMFGCEAWETTKAKLAFATLPVTLDPVRFERPEPFPVYRDARTVFKLDVP